MKSLMLTLVAALSLNAQVKAQTPAVDPIPEMPLLQLTEGGGMPIPGGLNSREITVSNYGTVTVKDHFYAARASNDPDTTRTYELPRVPAEDLEKIEETVAQLSGGEFVTPKEPGCMDAPGRDYNVFKGDKKIEVFRNYACMDVPLLDQSQRQAASAVKQFLDALLELTWKRPL